MRKAIVALVAIASIALLAYGIASVIRDNARLAESRNGNGSDRPRSTATTRTRRSTGSAANTGSVDDAPAPALTVRVLDVGQGDATYIRNGDSRIIIDGGPDERRMGELLDSLGLNGKTIDVVILSHAHSDHYTGLLPIFDSHRHIHVRYFFENKDPAAASTIARLRDSVVARIDRDSLIYRDTDDPCDDGSQMCTLNLRGGARLHIMRPMPSPATVNNRSVAVKLVGPDSASFTMWLAGDAEHDELSYFERAGYARNPGMAANVLKSDHHGSCNGVSTRYLDLVQPDWTIASLAAHNDYGHMHEQAKATYHSANVPWYRTDQNGTITIRSAGTPGSSYTITPSRPGKELNGPSDRESHAQECADM